MAVRQPDPRGNERLTAMTGAVLVVQVEADDLAVAPFPLPAATGFARLFKRPARGGPGLCWWR